MSQRLRALVRLACGLMMTAMAASPIRAAPSDAPQSASAQTVFVDAGNLLPDARSPGLNDMRYAIGVGLRYNLPIGPVRLDYGINPDPHTDEAFGAFHFSFGFAF
jgi:outer membrane protein assembly factor BamA